MKINKFSISYELNNRKGEEILLTFLHLRIGFLDPEVRVIE